MSFPPGSASAADAADPSASRAREAALVAWLEAHAPVIVGYSGGVDSTYLLAVARAALGRERVLAVLGVSDAVPRAQVAAAREAAAAMDVALELVATDELADAAYTANPANRCYHCKRILWDRIAPLAAARGGWTVCDGTNHDDLADYRPGGAAAAERGVRTPLAEAGLTKQDIRLLSRERGLSTWSQPSSPCLASRLPYGVAVTAERLGAVERAEAALRALGVAGDLRVRHHHGFARVELPARQLGDWLALEPAARLAAAVRSAGFARVAIDLAGFRSGSLNVLHGVHGDAAAAPPADEARQAAGARAGDAESPVSAHRVPQALGAALGPAAAYVTLERDGALALLRPLDHAAAGVALAALAAAAARAALLVALRLAGVTHVALELPVPDASGAPGAGSSSSVPASGTTPRGPDGDAPAC